jgi:hypothetical protein
MTCAQRTVRKSKQCTKTHRKAVDDLMVSGTDMCGDYFDQNARCDKLLAKTPTPDPKSYVRPKSLFAPVMALVDSYRTIRCDQSAHERMDRIVQRMFTLGLPDPIPETGAQLRQWCSSAMREAPFIYGYLESCLSDFGKLLIKVMAGSVGTSFQPYCGAEAQSLFTSPTPLMQEYVKAAKCGNRAEPKLIECTNDFVDRIMGIVEAPDTQRIRMGCWYVMCLGDLILLFKVDFNHFVNANCKLHKNLLSSYYTEIIYLKSEWLGLILF